MRRTVTELEANLASSVAARRPYLIQDVHGGVTVSWLAEAFHMNPATVKRRLADCPPLHRRKAGYVYELKQAAQYLVKPTVNVEQYIAQMKSTDLPANLQQSYWDAALKRQKWMENAGDLWRTADVMGVFALVFKSVKAQCQLFSDTVERTSGLTREQRVILEQLVDALQNDIYVAVKEFASSRSTPSQINELMDLDEAPAQKLRRVSDVL